MIWQAWSLHFDTLRTFLAACGHAVGPSDQQEGQVGVQNHILSGSDGLDSVFFSGLFPDYLIGILAGRGLKPGFRLKSGCENNVFLQKLCFGDSRVEF